MKKVLHVCAHQWLQIKAKGEKELTEQKYGRSDSYIIIQPDSITSHYFLSMPTHQLQLQATSNKVRVLTVKTSKKAKHTQSFCSKIYLVLESILIWPGILRCGKAFKEI